MRRKKGTLKDVIVQMLAQIWRVSFIQHLFIFIRDELIWKAIRVNIDSLWCVISLSQSVKKHKWFAF